MSFSADGRLVALSEEEHTTIRESSTRKPIAQIPAVAATLSFSPTDSLLTIGGFRQVSLWDTNTWSEARPPLPVSRPANHIIARLGHHIPAERSCGNRPVVTAASH